MGRWVVTALVLALLTGGLAGSVQASTTGETAIGQLDATFASIEAARAAAAQEDRAQAHDHARTARAVLENATEPGSNATDGLLEAADRLVNLTASNGTLPVEVANQAVRIEAHAITWILDEAAANRSNASHALDEGIAWLADRLDAPGREVAFDPMNDSASLASSHAREGALDALLAARVLEETAAAEALALQGNAFARHHAQRAGDLWAAVQPRLTDRVDEQTAQHLAEGLGNLTTRLESVQAGSGDLAGLTGPLTAITYHRSIDRLEGITGTTESALYLGDRTIEIETSHGEALVSAAQQFYRNHRPNYLRHGEGGVEETDEGFKGVILALENRTEQSLGEAAASAVEALHDSAHLGPGLRFEVGDLQSAEDGPGEIQLGFLNTGLEGLGAYRVVLEYDPGHLDVTDVEPGWAADNATVDTEEGRIAIETHGSPPAFGRVLAASLTVERLDENGTSQVEVVDHRFETPAGASALVGSVQDAQLGDPSEDSGSSSDDGHHHDHGSDGQDQGAGDGHDHDHASEDEGSPPSAAGADEVPALEATLAALVVAATALVLARRRR